MLKGFKDFILKGNVVDLAVAVIIGAAFNNIVQALVKDIFTPVLGIFGGTPDFSNNFFEINGSKFMYGDFLNQVVSFLLIAIVIYFGVVVPMNKIMEKIKKGESVGPQDKSCPECLSLVPLKARRCKYCTSVLKD